jgi:hypothetical protein
LYTVDPLGKPLLKSLENDGAAPAIALADK